MVHKKGPYKTFVLLWPWRVNSLYLSMTEILIVQLKTDITRLQQAFVVIILVLRAPSAVLLKALLFVLHLMALMALWLIQQKRNYIIRKNSWQSCYLK